MHTALRYAAGGFAEAKGKYRGSIVESFAVVPIGCCVACAAQDQDDKVRIAGINGSLFRRGGSGACIYCVNAQGMCLCMHTACMHTTAHVRTAKCHPKGHESRSASSRYSVVVVVVLLLQRAAARIVVRRRLQAASSRLCRRHDKRNRRWPLAQSHQGTTPAVSSSLKRSARQAREQKADGAWRWEGRLVVERRLCPS